MIAIKGVYDGKKFLPLESLPTNRKSKVIITFLEEFDDLDDIRQAFSQPDGFSFWNDEREDIYQDYLKKNENR